MTVCCDIVGGEWCSWSAKIFGPDCCRVVENNISRFYGSECVAPTYNGSLAQILWPIVAWIVLIFAVYLVQKYVRSWFSDDVK